MRIGKSCDNFVQHWPGLDQKSNAIIFFIIATPIAIQQIAIAAIIRPWLVVHSSDTYLGDET